MLSGLGGPENREVKACRWESKDKILQHSGNQRGTWNGCRGVQEALFRLGTGVVCRPSIQPGDSGVERSKALS
jgi:hypothetical protein